MPASEPTEGAAWRRFARLGLLVGVVAGVGVLIWLLPDPREMIRSLLSRIEDLGRWSALAIAAAYVAATLLLLPVAAIDLVAGALFGVVRGSLLITAAALVGATASFLVGRSVARGWVIERLGSSSRFRAIDEAVAAEGWKIVALTRLSPLLPFGLLNYAFGLTQIRLRHYVLATAVGMFPATVMYVYAGAAAAELALLEMGMDPGLSDAEWMLYIAGLTATIIVALYVARIAQQALARRHLIDPDESPEP